MTTAVRLARRAIRGRIGQMRRHDAPGEPWALAETDAAGGGSPGEQAELLRRLAGLRTSHPSSADYRGDESYPAERGADGERDAGAKGDTGTDTAADAGSGPGDEPGTDSDPGATGPEASTHDSQEGPQAGGRPGGPEHDRYGREGLSGHGHGGHSPAEPGRAGPLGARQPYRPWFSSGESAEPWFTEDPADPPG